MSWCPSTTDPGPWPEPTLRRLSLSALAEPRPLLLVFLALSSAFLARGAADSAPSAPAAFFLRRLPRSQLKARRRPDAPERDFFLRGGPPGPPGSSAAGAAGGSRAAMARREDLAAVSGPFLRGAHALSGRADAAGDAAGEKFGRRRPNERARSGRAAGGAGRRRAGRGGRPEGRSPRRERPRGGSGDACCPSPPPRGPPPRPGRFGAGGGRGPVPRDPRAPRCGLDCPGPRGRGREADPRGAVLRFCPGGATKWCSVR